MLTPIDLFRSFSHELDPVRLQEKFLQALMALEGVERGSLWIRQNDHYVCTVAAGAESEAVRGMRIPKEASSVVGWVIENGRMTVSEPGKDQRHRREVELGLAVKSSLILCFPLPLRDGGVFGAVQIIDTTPSRERLNLAPENLRRIQELIDIGSVALDNALVYRRQQEEAERLKHTLAWISAEERLIGQSPAFQQMRERMESFARTDFPVLVSGESGTGKELVARSIHRLSPRNGAAFLIQNCSAIPETLLESELFGYRKGAFSGAVKNRAGLFEAADGGSLFLDEIGDMPLNLQARILRVIQNGEVKPLGATQTKRVDVRLISATNRDLRQMVADNQFRQDLFFRLSVLPLQVPSLRQRREDIPLLLRHFLQKEAGRMQAPAKRFSPEALESLRQHAWAGNVRELENLVRYLLVVTEGEVITVADLPTPLLSASGEASPGEARAGERRMSAGGRRASDPAFHYGERSWEEVERDYVVYQLNRFKWNISRSARAAGINRSTFASRLRRLGIRKGS
jgi:transcriptional regulator with GAF, ATPase, and Fis domain